MQNKPLASGTNSHPPLVFLYLESGRSSPEGTYEPSADTRPTKAARDMPPWPRHHHVAMHRWRWLRRPQAPSCFEGVVCNCWQQRVQEAFLVGVNSSAPLHAADSSADVFISAAATRFILVLQPLQTDSFHKVHGSSFFWGGSWYSRGQQKTTELYWWTLVVFVRTAVWFWCDTFV